MIRNGPNWIIYWQLRNHCQRNAFCVILLGNAIPSETRPSKTPILLSTSKKTFCSYIKHFKDFMNILVNMLLEEIWFKMLYHQITISIQSYLLFFYPLGWVETWCNTIYNLHVSTHASAFLKCMKTSIIVCMS